MTPDPSPITNIFHLYLYRLKHYSIIIPFSIVGPPPPPDGAPPLDEESGGGPPPPPPPDEDDSPPPPPPPGKCLSSF